MNLPCVAVTVLMVIICVLIYAIRYCIRTYKLLITTQYILHNLYMPPYIKMHALYTHSVHGLACELIYCICICLHRSDPNALAH